MESQITVRRAGIVMIPFLAGVAIFGYVAAILVEVIARDVLTGVLVERRRRRAIEALRDHREPVGG